MTPCWSALDNHAAFRRSAIFIVVTFILQLIPCRFMTKPTKLEAHWSDVDINTLIKFLTSQLPTVRDGTGFKLTVWNKAAIRVNALMKTKGCDKTGPSCKNKWARVTVGPCVNFLLKKLIFHVYLVEGNIQHHRQNQGSIWVQVGWWKRSRYWRDHGSCLGSLRKGSQSPFYVCVIGSPFSR